MARICRDRARGAARRSRGARRPRRWRTASSTAASWRRPASRARACCRSTSTSRATASAASPVLRRDARRRPHQPPLRRAAWRPTSATDDLIRLAAYWKRFIVPGRAAACWWASCRGSRRYFDALQALAYEEGFTPGEVVLHRPRRPHDDLLACYAAAHVFVSMSEHEGFGVPLVESMLMRVPVLAYRGGRGAAHARRRRACSSARSALDEVAEMAHALATDERAARRPCWPARTGALRDFAPAARARRAARVRGVAVSDERPELAFVVQRYGAGHHGRLRVAGARGRRAAGRRVPRHRLHHLRARLRDLAQRAAGGARAARAACDVRRFPVGGGARPRRVQRFAEPLYGRARHTATRTRRSSWLRRQGPVTCRALVEALRRGAGPLRARSCSSPTSTTRRTGACAAAPERSVLVPTTHDEPPLRFSIYREVFALPRAFGFLTPAGGGARAPRASTSATGPRCVAGMGVDVPAAPDVERVPRAASARRARMRSTPGASTPARAARRCWRTTSATDASTRGAARPAS